MAGTFRDMQMCLFEKRVMKTCFIALLVGGLLFNIYYLYMDQVACCAFDELPEVDAEKQCSCPPLSDSTSISNTPTSYSLVTNTTQYSKCTLEVMLKNDTNQSDQTALSCCSRKQLLYSVQLTAEDMTFYNKCLNHTSVKMKGKINSSQCCFMDGSKRAAVALVSHPGSGNTWIRGLLEKATGVCTGSVYCDEELRCAGMRGESIRSGAVIVTKTHLMDHKWTDLYQPGHYKNQPWVPLYGSAILIVRNPYDAFVAEKSRLIGLLKHQPSHVSVANREYFGKNKTWNNYVKKQIKQWSTYFTSWLADSITKGHPIHVVKFENLKLDTFKEVKDMLDFLRFEYEEEELSARIKTDFNTFRRTHKGDEFDHYTMEQRLFINGAINSTIERLNKLNVTTNLELEKYLWHSS